MPSPARPYGPRHVLPSLPPAQAGGRAERSSGGQGLVLPDEASRRALQGDQEGVSPHHRRQPHLAVWWAGQRRPKPRTPHPRRLTSPGPPPPSPLPWPSGGQTSRGRLSARPGGRCVPATGGPRPETPPLQAPHCARQWAVHPAPHISDHGPCRTVTRTCPQSPRWKRSRKQLCWKLLAPEAGTPETNGTRHREKGKLWRRGLPAPGQGRTAAARTRGDWDTRSPGPPALPTAHRGSGSGRELFHRHWTPSSFTVETPDKK